MSADKGCVMASATLESQVLDGQIDWTIKNFQTVSKAFKSLDSPDFKFFFPQANKTFLFALKVVRSEGKPNQDDLLEFFLLNRNAEIVRMSAELFFFGSSSKSSSFIDAIEARSDKKFFRDQQDFSASVARQYHYSSASCDFNIRVKFSILDNRKSSASALHELVDTNLAFARSLRGLLMDKTFSDFVIKSGTETFPCHKAVLANRSDVFARLLRSEGGVGNNVLQLDSHKPAVIKQMIEFVYTYQLPEGTKSSPELLAIADQFNLKELALLCELELSKMVTCQNAIKILNIADKVAEAKRLKGFIIEFMSQNIFSFIGTADWKEIIEPNPELLNAIKSASVIN